jgi:NAD(P)-dependent dehydrogenase (short-subunit alcohol dehydrogenase family)
MIAAAFAAIEALTRALAVELGQQRVNTIRPGYTDSEMWQFLPSGQRDDLRRRVADALPVGRMGTPEDVAQAAVFLMTNPQVTGTVLEVTGGETLINTLE